MLPISDRAPGRPGPWALAPNVYAAAVDDDVVVLDVVADKYFCLGGVAATLGLGAGRLLRLADPELATDLAASGLIAPAAPGDDAGRRAAARPLQSAVRWSYPPPELGDTVPALQALWDVFALYRGQPLTRLVEHVARRGAPSRDPCPALLAIVDRFHAWAPFAPTSAKCLLRSFMLRRLLDRSGLAADWVFGVETWPFSAHCWLQAGATVLDDTVERVSRYTPIMVI